MKKKVVPATVTCTEIPMVLKQSNRKRILYMRPIYYENGLTTYGDAELTAGIYYTPEVKLKDFSAIHVHYKDKEIGLKWTSLYDKDPTTYFESEAYTLSGEKVEVTYYGGIKLGKKYQNTFLKFRGRYYLDSYNQMQVFSPWSDYRYVASMNGSAKSISHKKIKVKWKKVKGATGFDVYVSTKKKKGYKKVKSLKGNSTGLVIKKWNKKALKKNKKYYVKVVPKTKVNKKAKKSDIQYIYSCKIKK